jgi:nitrogen fixation/metabolism regulation signal transduction histidine kinase
MDLQFKYSLILIFTMIVEIIIVGIAAFFVLNQPKPEIPGANIYFIYKAVLAVILFLTICNITVGVYLSHKVAGPLYRFVMCSREVANGNLKIQVNLRKGDELRELEESFNEMTERLRSYVRRDREIITGIQASAKAIADNINKASLGKTEKDKILEAVKDILETSPQVCKEFTI